VYNPNPDSIQESKFSQATLPLNMGATLVESSLRSQSRGQMHFMAAPMTEPSSRLDDQKCIFFDAAQLDIPRDCCVLSAGRLDLSAESRRPGEVTGKKYEYSRSPLRVKTDTKIQLKISTSGHGSWFQNCESGSLWLDGPDHKCGSTETAEPLGISHSNQEGKKTGLSALVE
jgi:hypothetical protein